MSQLVKPVAPRLRGIPLNVGLALDCAFYEGGGSLTRDLVNRSVGVFAGNPLWSTDFYGRGVDFSGSGMNVQFPDTAQVSFVNGVSISTRFKTSNNNPNKVIVSKRLAFNSTGIPFELVIDQQQVSFRCVGNSTLNTGNIISFGNWNHVVCTWDGTTKIIYVNGVQVTSATQSGPITDNSIAVTVGALPSGSEEFQGHLNDVKVWNRAISLQEVLRIWNDPFVMYTKKQEDYYDLPTAPSPVSGSFFFNS